MFWAHFPPKIVKNLLVHQTNILKLGILIKRKGKKGANPNAERKTTTRNPPGTHSTNAKCNWHFKHISWDLAVLCSWISITTHSLCMIQPATTYRSHITLSACKICALYTFLFLCVFISDLLLFFLSWTDPNQYNIFFCAYLLTMGHILYSPLVQLA